MVSCCSLPYERESRATIKNRKEKCWINSIHQYVINRNSMRDVVTTSSITRFYKLPSSQAMPALQVYPVHCSLYNYSLSKVIRLDPKMLLCHKSYRKFLVVHTITAANIFVGRGLGYQIIYSASVWGNLYYEASMETQRLSRK